MDVSKLSDKDLVKELREYITLVGTTKQAYLAVRGTRKEEKVLAELAKAVSEGRAAQIIGELERRFADGTFTLSYEDVVAPLVRRARAITLDDLR